MICGAGCSRNSDERPEAITDFYRDSFEVIGRGTWSFVKVYLCKGSANAYAVKVRQKHKMPVRQTWKYAEKHKWEFAEEEKILSKLGLHSNIVLFITSFTEQAQHFQVFERLYGADLYPSVTGKYGGSHCEKDVVGYMRDILNGLRYCHEKKIIHRNVIPPNLFLTNSGSVKLVGFSLALYAKHDAGCYGVVGTAGYRAPEITWVDVYCYRVDLFACGCILYNLLTGSHPFIHNTRERSFSLTPAWKLISRWARDLVTKMLFFDPNKRITAAQALDHPFFHDVGRVGLNDNLTIAVEELTKFTEHKLWERVASCDDRPYLCQSRRIRKHYGKV